MIISYNLMFYSSNVPYLKMACKLMKYTLNGFGGLNDCTIYFPSSIASGQHVQNENENKKQISF